LFLPK
jgi:hypothetical protein